MLDALVNAAKSDSDDEKIMLKNIVSDGIAIENSPASELRI